MACYLLAASGKEGLASIFCYDNSREFKQLIAQTEKRIGIDLQPGSWHELRFDLRGDTVKVYLNSVFQLEHTSPGFGHPTKENIALSVPKQATIDVLQVWDQAGRR